MRPRPGSTLRTTRGPETRWRPRRSPFPSRWSRRVEVDRSRFPGASSPPSIAINMATGTRSRRANFAASGWSSNSTPKPSPTITPPASMGPRRTFEAVPERHSRRPCLPRRGCIKGRWMTTPETGRNSSWAADYWPGDPDALAHTEDLNGFLETLAERGAPARRASDLRGSALRHRALRPRRHEPQDRPFTVTEARWPAGRNRRQPTAKRLRIFFPHPVAQRTTQWERGGEPMTQLPSPTNTTTTASQAQVSLAVPRHRDYRLAGTPGSRTSGR